MKRIWFLINTIQHMWWNAIQIDETVQKTIVNHFNKSDDVQGHDRHGK